VIDQDGKSIRMQPKRPLMGKILIALATIFGIVCHSFDKSPNASVSGRRSIVFDSKPIVFKEIRLEIFKFAKNLIFALAEEIESRVWASKIHDRPLPLPYVQRLCRKWEDLFDAPVEEVLSILKIESDFNPAKRCLLRSKKGGAWGLGGQMLDEAHEKISAIKHQFPKNPKVTRIAGRFRGTGPSLLDPELNVMLTAFQIGQIHQRFDDFEVVAAAYHQGANIVSWRLRNGQPPVSRLKTPRGHLYVERALQAFSSFRNSATMAPQGI
jgi:hypothetical protein